MIKTNIKMRVTPEQSVKVQEICFNEGCSWYNSDRYIYERYLFIHGGSWIIQKSDSKHYYEAHSFREINPELFIKTNGTCKDFQYPMRFKSKKWDYVVEFTDLRQGIVVAEGVHLTIKKDFSCSIWTTHTDSSTWEQVENPDLATDKGNNKAKNPNSKHYELWENFEAIDLIKLALTYEEYKGFLKGNILKYRLRAGKKNIENDNIIKDINKSIDYERELNK
jgi:hypothetical protein